MKKLLLVLAAVLVLTGCKSNDCGDCRAKKPLPCCEEPAVRPEPVIVRQEPIYTAPIVEEVTIPLTRVTTTYKVIEYKKGPAQVRQRCGGEIRCAEPMVEYRHRPVVEYRNRPVRYISQPAPEPKYIHREVKPVQEPVKLIAPTTTTYYTEDDWVK